MKLSVIIPAYNEEKTILAVINKVKSVSLPIGREIIVVDDCSEDSTRKMLSELRDGSIKIFFHRKNMGKGAAVRTGITHASGNIILVQDADFEYNPEEYPRLLKPIIEGKAEVVYGSRIESIRSNLRKMYKLHYLGNVFLTAVTNLLYGSKITDMETGYKVFRKEVIDGIRIRAKGVDFEPEITAKILKRGFRIEEVRIDFMGRRFDEGKKITWVDGIKAAYYLIKYRFID